MINKNTKYSEFLRNWINIYKKPYIKTWYQIRDNVRLHIPDSVKSTRLCDLNAMQIQSAINDVESSRVRVEIYNIYHGSLLCAYKLGVIERDISCLLIKPKHIQNVGKALTSAEINAFLERIAGTRYENFYRFLLFTGVRRSEALNLKYGDIDFDNLLIHIRGTKNKTSDRYIPFLDRSLDFLVLDKMIIRSFNLDSNLRVFPFSKQRVSVFFHKIMPNHKLHDLRHTFATHCLECGVSMSVVQKWLGHSTITTTSKIYSHILPEFEKIESQKVRW